MNPLHTLSLYFFNIHFNIILGTEQDGLSRNNSDLRPEDGLVEYRPAHRPPSLSFFSFFLIPYKQIPGQHHKLDYCGFLPHLFQFIIHCHPIFVAT
jgi:hypothetical protein